jgi:hypothetical protein
MEPPKIAPTPKPTQRQRILRYVLYTIVGLAVGVAFLFLFWVVQSPNVLDVKNSPFPIRPPVVAQDDIIWVKANYCKNSDAKGELVVRLIGKRSIIRLPYGNEAQAAGCVDRELPIPIPEYATDDVYYIQFDVTYQVNPIKTQMVTMRSQEFTVKSR